MGRTKSYYDLRDARGRCAGARYVTSAPKRLIATWMV